MERIPSYDYKDYSTMVFFFLALNILLCGHGFSKVVSGCVDSEREALTTFRKALTDSDNFLSFWGDADDVASDCCKWRGVFCDKNNTGHVVKLDLHHDVGDSSSPWLSGQIHPALLELKHLQFLDLSFNAFYDIPIPEFLGSMKKLRHLNLSYAGFDGRIPRQLGNLSNLISLQLSSTSLLSAENIWWVTNMTSLEYLDMSFVNLSLTSHTWVHVMNQCPSLVELHLSSCGLSYISPALSFVNLTFLRVFDLSLNEFNSKIPKWIANITSLMSLHLVGNNFHGQVPYAFSELPHLEDLSLGEIEDNLTPDWLKILEGSWNKLKRLLLQVSHPPYRGIPASIGNITSLVFLDLSFSENREGRIPRTITDLVSLEHLTLRGCNDIRFILDGIYKLKHLSNLELSLNSQAGPIPASLGQLSNLNRLYMSYTSLSSPIPKALGSLSSLKVLRLSGNQLNGTIPVALGQLSNLRELDISYNSLTGPIPVDLGQLRNLRELDISSNSLTGPIPADLGQLSNLRKLDISYSSLTGPIPADLGQLRNLRALDISYNSLTGPIPAALGQLRNLASLDISYNSLTGPIPAALGRLSQLMKLDISSNRLTSAMPISLWDLAAGLSTLNISHNMISGQLPNPLNMSPFLSVLDLSFNQFSGPIPPNFTAPSLAYLSISNNQISGTTPPSIGEMVNLVVLDLSRNKISGGIPSKLCNCETLEALDLSRNHLSGGIPKSLGLLNRLKTLQLSNNSLSGKLTLSLKNCTLLETLDLGENRFSGNVPAWVGKSFPHIRILRLRSNLFTGELPPQLSLLTSLQVLDVAENGLSGSIPVTFKNLMAMKDRQTMLTLSLQNGSSYELSYYKETLLVSTKGQTYEFSKTLSLLTSMDLSSNNFSGKIPEGFTNLLGLRILNLSKNHLTGKIPAHVGKLALMESLDLSKNQLSGSIPRSMSNLNFLSFLNLSHNKLSGEIPLGHQLQTLDNSSYIGNNGLCGFPLTKKCVEDEAPQVPIPAGGNNDKDDEENEMFWFYVALGPGFSTGFWAFCGVLLLKKSWRIAYFRFFDEMKDKVFVTITLLAVRLKKFEQNPSHK